MTAGELALVIATVLCVLGFTGLVVALVFVIRSLGELRAAVEQLDGGDAAAACRAAQLGRRGPRRSRSIRQGARFRGGDLDIGRRRVAGGAGRPLGACDQDGGDRVGHVASGAAVAEATMKRVVWFTAGAAAGVAGTAWTQRKVKHVAAAAKPRAVATKAAERVRDAVREGRLAMRQKEAELRAELDPPPEVVEVVEVQTSPTRRTRRVMRVRIPAREPLARPASFRDRLSARGPYTPSGDETLAGRLVRPCRSR